MHSTINCKGRLIDLSKPLVMGIVNINDDSFYAGSRCNTEDVIMARVQLQLHEGASIIDIGAYSTRPGCADVPPDVEMERIALAMKVINGNFPEAIVSVDTFRADVARFAVEECGVSIVNDISGGTLDDRMFATVADLHVPYIMMHIKGTPQTMQQYCHYDNMMDEIIKFFAERVERLKLLGVNDVIIDPGFGFAKDLEQNYELMQRLDEFKVFGLPILVGISRKSMIYKLLGNTPNDALNGTTVLNTIALTKGANILRVHDVQPAMEAIRICEKTGLI
jgi:dihydropteroate synthase